MPLLRGAAYRGGIRSLLLPVIAGIAATAPLDAQEQGLFELHIPALPTTQTVPVLLDSAGQPLVPLSSALRYAGIPATERGDTLLLEWPPEIWSSRLNLASRELHQGNTVWTIPDAEWADHDGEVFLSPAALGRVLAATVEVDWENLTLRLRGRNNFPAVVQMNLQGQRAAAQRTGGGALLRPREPRVPYHPHTGGAALGWGLAGSLGDQLSQTSARAAGGVALFGGSLEVGSALDLSTTRGPGISDPFIQYNRAFPNRTGIRQVRMGDILAEGLIARPVFGVAISNEPLYRSEYFGDVLLQPVVPAGWEMEVYQGSHLVGVAERGTGQQISAPLGYGTTPIRIRIISPAGEERIQELVFLVPAHQVPPGEWRYSVGGGRCRFGQCGSYGYADLRRGISQDLTVGAGLEVLDSTRGQRAVRPYAGVNYNLLPNLRGELRYQPGSLLRLALQQQNTDGGGWHVAGGWNARTGDAPLLPTWQTEGRLTARIPWANASPLIGLQASARGAEGRELDAWQTALSTAVPGGQFSITYESGFQPRDVLGLEALSFLTHRRLDRLRNLSVSTRLNLSGSGIYSWTVGTSFQPRDRAGVYANLSWFPEAGAPSLSVGLITRTPAAYLQTSASSSGGRRSVSVSAGGGAAYGVREGLLTLPTETIGRGGVTGRVYVDENGDGRWSPHEPAAVGVPVSVGGDQAITDADGRYMVWGVRPYAAVAVGVDTLNLPTTALAPRGAPTLVRPAPNMYTRVDLAMVPTRELAGRVRWRGKARILGGISVEALRLGETEPRKVLTFSDGEFYISHLPAGSYALTVRESSLAALGATAEPVPLWIEVPSHGAEGGVDAGTIFLRSLADTLSVPVPSTPRAQPRTEHPPSAERSHVLHFDFDRATLRKAATAALDSVVAALRADPHLQAVLSGHTDHVGEDVYNDRLGRKRARAAAVYLSAHGISPQRLLVRTFGEQHPAESNFTDSGRQANRRVDVRLFDPRAASAP